MSLQEGQADAFYGVKITTREYLEKVIGKQGVYKKYQGKKQLIQTQGQQH